jgi:CheY-like chemotaxis protein
MPMLGARSMPEPASLATGDGATNVAQAGVLGRLKVLVVDDDEDARDLISTTMRHAGAQVMSASSADEALQLLESAEPDVIVSDIAMPNGTGYDLVRQVRATPRLARIPAIALTAFGRLEDRERALDAGFNFHVVKPVEPMHLVHAVAAAVGRA